MVSGRAGMARLVEIVRVDLIRRVRNRSAVITAFVAPLALALMLGFILGGLSSTTFEIGVVDEEGSERSALIIDALQDDVGGLVSGGGGLDAGGGIEVRVIGSRAEAEEQVDDGELAAAIVVPDGYTADEDGGVALVVLRSPERAVGGQVGTALAGEIADQVNRLRVADATAQAVTGQPLSPELALAVREAPTPLVATPDPETGAVSAEAYFGASMCILFLFFTVGFAARSVLIDREQGILQRILSTPVSLGSVIAGKSISVAFLGTVGFFGVWFTTTAVFGASWGHPVGVVVLILASVLAIGGVSMLVSSLGRTERQADSYTTMLTFVLALLGGNFVALGSAPALFRRLTLATPNGWALKGFTDLSAGAGTSAAVLPAAVLLAVAALTGVIGVARIRRTVGA